MPKPLLVEIGCEELPARMVENLGLGLAAHLNRHLRDTALTEVEGRALWTPRRLLYLHDGLQEAQPVSEVEVLGPPARISLAPDGGFTAAATAFAAKSGATAADLYRVNTPKGEYVAVRRRIGGNDARDILSAIVPKAFQELELPRSMRWEADTPLRFLRPVRWVVALLGEDVVPLRIGSLASGRRSRGHRTLGQGEFEVASPAAFPAAWTENGVIADPAERGRRIREAAQRCLADTGGRIRVDDELLDMLVDLTEFPDSIRGDFDPGYLKTLPAEVLVTVMRDHQKYFAVEDTEGRLLPHFVAVINQRGDARGLIRYGNERVLRARFSDARFFWDQDRKLSLVERLPLLDHVIFQIKLGSYRQKSRRLRALAAWLAERWPGCNREDAAVAAELAKCDLTTEMVKEFPELQGIMGGHYARAEGRSETVATAIAGQYSWETQPASLEAAAVSVADKLDTIVGMFAIGEIPTGSADPFALRRQGNGVIRALIEGALPLSLAEACGKALEVYSLAVPTDPRPALAAFFRERLAFYLTDVAGFEPALVAAVLAAGSDQPVEALRRASALKETPQAAAVAAVVKRARSIVRKERWTSSQVNPALLTAPAEQALHQAVAGLPETPDYAAELAAIAGLAVPLDRFFNEVRVNDGDAALRANRLSLLAWVVERLSRLADFSELAGA